LSETHAEITVLLFSHKLFIFCGKTDTLVVSFKRLQDVNNHMKIIPA